MAQRCPGAVVLGSSVLPARRLTFRGRPGFSYATLEPGPDSVPVLVWEITAADEAALDDYEDFPETYRKETVTVTVGARGEVAAMIYLMNDGFPFTPPDPAYLAEIVDGYIEAGFDTTLLHRGATGDVA